MGNKSNITWRLKTIKVKKDKWLVPQHSVSSEEVWPKKNLVQFVKNYEPDVTKRTQLIGLINRGMVKNLDALELLIEKDKEQLAFAEVAS